MRFLFVGDLGCRAAGFIVLAVGAKLILKPRNGLRAGSVAGFLVSLPRYQIKSIRAMQFDELAPWISSFNINFTAASTAFRFVS